MFRIIDINAHETIDYDMVLISLSGKWNVTLDNKEINTSSWRKLDYNVSASSDSNFKHSSSSLSHFTKQNSFILPNTGSK